MKIGFVGYGAIASVLMARCEKLALEYRLLTRQPEQPHIAVNLQGEAPITLHPNALSITQGDDLDVLVLALKAFDIEPAVQQLKPWLPVKTTLLLLHNGLGTQDTVTRLFPKQPVAIGVTHLAAYKPSRFQTQQTGNGSSYLGWVQQPTQTEPVERLLSSLLPPCQWEADIHLRLWQKLTINAVINPLTAIYNIKNGELVNAEYQQQRQSLIKEICALGKHLGYAESAAELSQRVLAVCHATAQNYSSMQQDIAHKRRSEIDFITGYLLHKAKAFALPMPANQACYNKVVALQSVR